MTGLAIFLWLAGWVLTTCGTYSYIDGVRHEAPRFFGIAAVLVWVWPLVCFGYGFVSLIKLLKGDLK